MFKSIRLLPAVAAIKGFRSKTKLRFIERLQPVNRHLSNFFSARRSVREDVRRPHVTKSNFIACGEDTKSNRRKVAGDAKEAAEGVNEFLLRRCDERKETVILLMPTASPSRFENLQTYKSKASTAMTQGSGNLNQILCTAVPASLAPSRFEWTRVTIRFFSTY